MKDSWGVLRETGAAARSMLLAAASSAWSVPPDELATDDGEVIHAPSGRREAYAAFVAAAAQLNPPLFVSLKEPSDYRWIGTTVPRVDLLAKVTGQAVYGMDVQLDDMLTAVVARVPEMGGQLTGYDSTAATDGAGVRGFVELPNGVAVVADHFWAARKAAALITLQWRPGPLTEFSYKQLQEECLQQFERDDSDYVRAEGDSSAALTVAATRVEAEYRTPYLAHAMMEPLNTTVHVSPDRCDVWVPTQTPDMAQNIVAELTGLPREQVHVNSTFCGGGFGRRVRWDYGLEAALVARELDVPVKTVWTREDEIRHGYFRQQTAHRMRAGLTDEGSVSGWEHRQVATPTAKVLMGPSTRTMLPEALALETRRRVADWLTDTTLNLVAAFQAREGAEELDYGIADTSFMQYSYDPGVPISIWRSVGNSYNGFVVESFIDELAAAAGTDPVVFRRQMLSDPRHLAVFDKVVELSYWGNAPEGRAHGIAFFPSFGSVVAQIAEVSLADSGPAPIRVHKVTCVVDCGRAITPDIVRQQMESGIVFGLTAALYGEIVIENGQAQQSNFHDYPMLRLADAPDIDVYVMPSEEGPEGVGEPGVPPIAPAVANARFALPGTRCRSLPLQL